jgi:hypothetical protein
MYKLDQSKIPQMAQGDPLLGAIGSMVGSAIGGSVGGPAGAAIGGSIGGQLGGTGTVDLEQTAIDSTKGAAGSAVSGALGSAVDTQLAAGKNAMALGINPMSEQAQMLADQGGSDFAVDAFEPSMWQKTKARFFNQGGQIPYPSSNIPGGQGLQTGLVDDLAMGITYAPAFAKLTSPISALFGEIYTDKKMDNLDAASKQLNAPQGMMTISDKAGNVRQVDQGQMDAYNALNRDPLQGLQGFGNRPEAEAVAKHGFGSPQHFAQVEAQEKEVKTGTGNVSGDRVTNVVRGSSGAPLRNSRDGSVIANANQPSTDSTGETGGK